MRWIRDPEGLFPERLFFDSLDELDTECERLTEVTFRRRRGRSFSPPLDDQTLEVLVEDDADLDSFAVLPEHIDGYTKFSSEHRPLIHLNTALSSDERRRVRWRTTLAHEWFHAVYHRAAWEKLWALQRLKEQDLTIPRGCHQDEIVAAHETKWLEFQAGYASCALLMPKSWIMTNARAFLSRMPSTTERQLVKSIAEVYQVSEQAAAWRLRQLRLIPFPSRQVDLF